MIGQGPFYWADKETEEFMKRGYLVEGTTIATRVRQIGNYAEQILGMEGFSDRFFKYVAYGWYSLATPVWSNFGLERGLPISCFGSYMEDDTASILRTAAEVGMMSKKGGGTSVYFGSLRPRGARIKDNGYSNGSFSFARLFDRLIEVFNQGSTRRGQCAGYIDIEHPDIDEWLLIRREGSDVQNMVWGVCVGSDWIKSMVEGDEEKRLLWAKILQSRAESGVPFIFFRDNANTQTVDVYRDMGKRIYASNLCTEIMLPSSSDESFVCCLSSLNLRHYDEWKDTDAVETLVFFLDAVMEDFIRRSESVPFLDRARRFALRHRALGMGVLGWHSYLQSKGIPFDSMEAFRLNSEIFSLIRDRAYDASCHLATKFGEPEYLKGYGRRNATLLAVAPTKSSSFILARVSPSVEPLLSNYFIKDTEKRKIVYKNPFLEHLLSLKGKNNNQVWRSIQEHNGSVQHLDFLTDEERAVFKTFSEITPMTIIQQAAQRQRFIDQGQSINLRFHVDTDPREINKLILTAHDMGIKSLYYQYSDSVAQQTYRSILDCSVCES